MKELSVRLEFRRLEHAAELSRLSDSTQQSDDVFPNAHTVASDDSAMLKHYLFTVGD